MVGTKMLRPGWLLCELRPLCRGAPSQPNPETNSKNSKFRQKQAVYLFPYVLAVRVWVEENVEWSQVSSTPLSGLTGRTLLDAEKSSHGSRMPFHLDDSASIGILF